MSEPAMEESSSESVLDSELESVLESEELLSLTGWTTGVLVELRWNHVTRHFRQLEMTTMSDAFMLGMGKIDSQYMSTRERVGSIEDFKTDGARHSVS